MKKDVIYVDIEDDITSIIDKVKSAGASIVALVPPKRIGVLQSVVNLKLLQKAAKTASKTVVLITNDQALTALAAGVAIPIAKNLQSKPEIPEIAALDVDDEDIINGDELPVGDLAQNAPAAAAPISASKVTPPSAPAPPPSRSVPTPMAATAAQNAPKKKGPRVPNFEIFRKNVLLFVGIGIVLVAGLIWAIFFAPHATVTITAKTNASNINQQLNLIPNGTLDAAQKVLPAVVQQTKKTNSIDFDATGKKEVGEKATGTVKFTNNTQSSTTVAAGTRLTTDGGLIFVTNSAVTVPGGTISCNPFPNCQGVPGTANGNVTADGPGTKYNGATGNLTGGPGGVTESFNDATSGGTDKTATVVSQDDVDKAKGLLAAQDADQVKKDLKKQFKGDVIIIDESFKADAADPVSSPKVGDVVTGKAKLTSETTYTLVGIMRSDLKSVFQTYLKTQINSDEQKIYADGDEAANFSQFQSVDKNYTVKVQADGQVGPKIDDAALKTQLAGKRAGEIQQMVSGIQGVEDVDTKFSPFWVTTAPDAKKITIKFVLKNDN